MQSLVVYSGLIDFPHVLQGSLQELMRQNPHAEIRFVVQSQSGQGPETTMICATIFWEDMRGKVSVR